MKSQRGLIEVRTGSDSDIPKIRKAYEFFESLGIPYSPRILSAHRTPQAMAAEARRLSDNGFFVSIAAAGGSAHLPGMTASETVLPVIGLPVTTSNLSGQDSLYSIIQMPDGIPVGCVGIGESESAAILASEIAYNNDSEMRNRIRAYRGIEGTVPVKTASKVGIIKAAGTEIDERKYSEMTSSMEKFGLTTQVSEVSAEDVVRVKSFVRELENEGAVAVIVIGGLGREKPTNDFPAKVSEMTDIPSIGLPLAKGFAGNDPRVEGDIFYNMLCSTAPTGKLKGHPIAGMGINRYMNAGLFAAQIAGLFDRAIQDRVKAYRDGLAKSVKEKDARIQKDGILPFLK